MTISRRDTVIMQEECVQALQSVADKFGLKVRAEGGSLEQRGAILKFAFAETTVQGDLMTPEFLELRRRYPEIAGYTFYIPGKGYVKPIGWKTRNRKYPVIYEKDGKTWKSSAFVLEGCTMDRREDDM